MKTSIITTVLEAGTDKKRKRSFSDINPEATNTELKNFARQVVGLTTGTYVETERVDKINVDGEETRKHFRNISVSNATPGATATISITITEGSTINPAVFFYANNNVTLLTTTAIESTDPTIAKKTVAIPNNSGEMYIGTLGNSEFYSEFVFVSVQ